MRFAIVALAMASCGVVPVDRYGTRVTMSPQLGLAPLVVEVRAAIDRPAPEWFCPDVVVTWTDGTESKRLSDCDPWSDATERWAMWPMWRRLGPGTHRVIVTLRQGAKTRQFELFAEVS